MEMVMKNSIFTVTLLTVLLVLPAYGGAINKSVKIAAGEEADGASSVNGSVIVAENVQLNDPETVNGKISVGKESSVDGSV
jgi:hypothetical protein